MEYPVINGRDPHLVRYGMGDMDGGKMPYFSFVKQYHEGHPKLTWMQAVKKASKLYHEVYGAGIPAGEMDDIGGAWYGDPEIHSIISALGWIRKFKKEGKIEKAKAMGAKYAPLFKKLTDEGKIGFVDDKFKVLDASKGKATPEQKAKTAAKRAATKKKNAKNGKCPTTDRELGALKSWETKYKEDARYKNPEKAKKMRAKISAKKKALKAVCTAAKKASAAGILAGGEESELERHIAALKGWVGRYNEMGEPAMARREKMKLY